jgi:DNA-binding GntR family transcriptional regulator
MTPEQSASSPLEPTLSPGGSPILLPPFAIERSTTVDRIAAALREEILSGRIAPGTRLREIDLAAAVGAARGTVREAITGLVSEGLLTRSSYKGVEVTRLTVDDIKDIYAARRTIELSAVDVACSATRDQLQPLLTAIGDFVTIAASGDSDEVHLADVQIHLALVRLLDSPRLSRIHAGLLAELRLVLSTEYDLGDRRDGPINSHREFRDLILSGRREHARAQLEGRLRTAEAEAAAKLSPS